MSYIEDEIEKSRSDPNYAASHNTIAEYSGNTGVPRTQGGLYYLGNSPDSYVNALNTEQEWLREDLIRREGYAREDSAYTRLFNELKSLGVNPALLLSSGSPTVGSAGGNSAGSIKTSNFSANEKTEAANSAKVAGSIIAAIAIIGAALIHLA